MNISASGKPKSTSSRKIHQGIATAASILDIARALFEENGFAATTMQEVIDRAGLTKGALYHHYPSKMALFEAVYRSVEDSVAEQIARSSATSEDPFEQLVAGCFAYLDCACSHDMHRILRAEGPAALGFSKWQQIDREYGVYRILPFLEQLRSSGVLDLPSVEAFAFQITGAMNEATFWISDHPVPRKAMDESKRQLRKLLDSARP